MALQILLYKCGACLENKFVFLDFSWLAGLLFRLLFVAVYVAQS